MEKPRGALSINLFIEGLLFTEPSISEALGSTFPSLVSV